MSDERLALPAAATLAQAVAINAPAPPLAPMDLPERPKVLRPAVVTTTGDHAPGPDWSVALDDVAIPIPESAPSWAHDSGHGTFTGREDADFVWHSRPDMTFKRRRKRAAGTSPRAGQQLRAVLFTGALLTTFALGWIGGATWHRMFEQVTIASPVKQKLSTRLDARNTSEPGRGAGATTPSIRKLSSSPASRPERVAAVAVPSETKDLPHLVPVPETRPTTIEGWSVREVTGSTAVLEGPDGIWRVARGDIVPGVGRVDSIVRWGNYWLVATTRGLIATE